MTVTLYVEGGGDSKSGHIACREGFRKLLSRAGFEGRMPRIKACGTRARTYDDFRTALRISGPSAYPVLLVDSEAPVSKSAWAHLGQRDNWSQPDGADDDQAQLMVQCMETWCIADREALRAFFLQCLQESALPAPNDLETRPKEDVQEAMERATRTCERDRTYTKGRRSFELLGKLNPSELRKLPHFAALCEVLERKLRRHSTR